MVAVARAADSLGLVGADDWVDLGTQMLGRGADDPPVVDLAILAKPASPWSTDRPVAALYELLDIAEPAPEEATLLVARVVADDLRARPEVSVTSPMIRILARLACDDRSALADECRYAAELLDSAGLPEGMDPRVEARHEGLPALGLPDEFVRPLARGARASLTASRRHRGR